MRQRLKLLRKLKNVKLVKKITFRLKVGEFQDKGIGDVLFQ